MANHDQELHVVAEVRQGGSTLVVTVVRTPRGRTMITSRSRLPHGAEIKGHHIEVAAIDGYTAALQRAKAWVRGER